LGYALGSIIVLSLLIVTLILWKVAEKSLSVSNIKTLRGEIFYWVAILFSNTLGTALGDYLADDSGLGFAGGAFLIGGFLALIVVAYYQTKISHVILFWLAFVLTRPFGATFGDFLTKSGEKGGLNFGTLGCSAILFLVLVLFVAISIFKLKNERKNTTIVGDK
jgi:uncharacterized membrane-anchored protein